MYVYGPVLLAIEARCKATPEQNRFNYTQLFQKIVILQVIWNDIYY